MTAFSFPPVLIKGAGEHASGTAHRLFRAGFPVVMTEIPAPTCVRRLVSFASVVWEGRFTVEGVEARLAETLPQNFAALDYIPVLLVENARTLVRHFPIIVDARIAKRNLDNRLEDAELIIGLGPGLSAGRDVHVVVETQRGHDLGRIIEQGEAAPDTGIPGSIGGFTRERVLRSPATGIFVSQREIGETIAVGDTVGEVEGRPVPTKIAGVLRGLIRSGTAVTEGLKIGDVDPRGQTDACRTLSDKTRTLSGSVLEIILRHLNARR